DDCNGIIDDLGVLTCGVGACARTVAACILGVAQVCVPGVPAPEVCNGIDDNCNGLVDEDPQGVDTDGGGVANGCDNCVATPNPDQSDFDHDGAGDVCDLDDGLILESPRGASEPAWQQEMGFDAFNLYRGDLGSLSDTDGDGAAQSYGACLAPGLV